ncbi:uncharacterized protein LOC112690122 [Sipha flava]|nr:uncharacterized protein LOC112690122 [Sipha flava]
MLASKIEELKIEMLENEKKIEDILKNSSRKDNTLLEKEMNNYFKLHCKLEGCQENLKKPELKDYCMDPPNTLMIFVSNIPKATYNLGPEALIVAASKNVSQHYLHLLCQLGQNNVLITTIQALTEMEVSVPLGNVKTALLDGSEDEYQQFVGSEIVLMVISSHVSADRLFFVRSDVHREACFQYVYQNVSA